MTLRSSQPAAAEAIWLDHSCFASAPQWPNDYPRVVFSPASPLSEPDGTAHCYLVERGVIATYVPVDQNRITCVGLLGCGELVGLEGLFGDASLPAAEARPVIPVQTLRIPAAELRTALQRTPALRQSLLRQMHSRLVAAQHVAACNARHLLPQRCAHWLLRLRAHLGDALPVTHEFLATVLGVRRAGVTVTLQALQRSGIIRQQRGTIVVVDARRLEAAGCRCPIPSVGYEERPFVLPTIVADAPEAAAGHAGIEAAIRRRMEDSAEKDAALARIAAAIDVCKAVMSQTEAVLVS